MRKFLLIILFSTFLILSPLSAKGETPCTISDSQSATTTAATLTATPIDDETILDDVDAAISDEPIAKSENENFWLKRLRKGTLNLKDTTVVYPRFIKFCVDVYNWADTTFNGVDKSYIESTGKRWKWNLKSDNWLDSYAMDFIHEMPIWLYSDPYCNFGVNLSYMAVSVGYSLDMTNIIGNRPAMHKKFDFNFSCARFWIDAYYGENKDGTYIRRFGDYNDRHNIKEEFPGLNYRFYGLDGYFFFNNRRYSQGAAYNFSKIQRRSAGSFILGLSYSNYDINVDFASLPEDMLKYFYSDQLQYKFHYNDYCLLIGYGYNWVFARNFLFNITALPAAGFKYYFKDCVEGPAYTWSVGVRGKIGITYNIGDAFMGLTGKIDGHWFRGSKYNFFNSIENLAFTVGARF
jgi:hypothetical protein